MALGWKVLFPLSLVAVTWTAITLAVAETTADATTYSIVAGIILGWWCWDRGQLWRRSGLSRPDMTDRRGGLGWASFTPSGR
jgi:hypothetical protein